ncbi:ABC-F type ribosomal protection protein [Oceanobacillus sp. FSL K6-2867]|uniref:ribosomal protection-like ABC-F family protein n=1 Tax=Oceanobacillus sp. FSL K6-2867 TaxID=2954748 RepID=UPI0030DCC449
MIACSVNQVSKMYGGNSIFENISFEIMENERVGLVGRNGSGKSTLFRILSGEEAPDFGKIHWRKETKIGYLAQIPEAYSELTTKDVLNNAFSELNHVKEKMMQLEIAMTKETKMECLEKLMRDYGNFQDHFARKGGYEIEANIDKIVNGLNIHDLLEHPFSSLSGGEKTKVGLGLSLLKEPDLLLLDEPTNHLDLMAVEWLSDFLQGYQGTVVIVSHDRYFLDEVVGKVLDLEDGEITSYATNFSGYIREKEKRVLKEFQAYEEQQKKIKKMKEAIKRLREWANRANPPNEGLHKRARNMERALERMEKINRPVLSHKKMNLEMETSDRSGKDVIILKDVSKRFGDRELFTKVNMHIRYQQRVAIVGENGTGKSTLIKLMLKQLCADEGEVRIGSNVKAGYLSQQIFTQLEGETVIDVFRNDVHVTEGEARHILARFLFYGHMVFQKVSMLSGGEKMRLRLAQLMYQDINVLVLDEPTNHLDIESREVLEEALEDYRGTIVAVSHDRYFLNKLFEEVYWIDAKTVYRFGGNYTWAREKLNALKPYQEQFKLVDRRKKQEPVNREDQLLKNEKLEKEIEKVEYNISILEKRLEEIQDLDVLQKVYIEKEELEKVWEKLYVRLNS